MHGNTLYYREAGNTQYRHYIKLSEQMLTGVINKDYSTEFCEI